MSGDDGRSPADNFITTHLIDIPRMASTELSCHSSHLCCTGFYVQATKKGINQHDAHVRWGSNGRDKRPLEEMKSKASSWQKLSLLSKSELFSRNEKWSHEIGKWWKAGEWGEVGL